MAEAPPVSGTLPAGAGLGPSRGAEIGSVASPRAPAIHIARAARTKARDSGSEGPSHARRGYRDLDRPPLGCETPVSRESGFVPAPSESMWASRLLRYVTPSARPCWCRGRTDLQQAGVGRVTARDGDGLSMRGGLARPGAAERARAEHQWFPFSDSQKLAM